MKTIFTLLASLVLSISAFAVPAPVSRPKSTLIIQSADRGELRVIIDGRRFEPYDNYLRVRGLDAGFHNVKVYRERNFGFFGIFGKQYEVVFTKSIMLKPSSNIMMVIDRFGRVTLNENRSRVWGSQDRNSDYHQFDNGNDWGQNNRDNMNWDNAHDYDFDRSRNTGDYNFDRNNRYDNGNNNDWGYNNRMVISEPELNRTLSSITIQANEDIKMTSVRHLISTNYFTSMQINHMMELFSIEKNKLEIAKLGYSKAVDKQNYQLVIDALSFGYSKDDLSRFLRNNY